MLRKVFSVLHLSLFYTKIRVYILNNLRTKFEYRFKKKKINLSSEKPNIVLLGIPSFANLGDQAILLAERVFINEIAEEYNLVEIEEKDVPRIVNSLHCKLKKKDIVMYHGGGNVGTMGLDQEYRRRIITKKIDKVPIVSFPQSIFFSKKLNNELKRSQEAYKNDNFSLILRENYSMGQANILFKNVQTELTPDIVFYLLKEKKYKFLSKYNGKKILLVIRNDKEKEITDTYIDKIFNFLLRNGYLATRTDMSYPGKTISENNRTMVVRKKLSQFEENDIIITDRLHGLIFSILKARPVIALKNSNYKIESTVKTWLNDCPLVYFITDPTVENIKHALQKIEKIDKEKVYKWYEHINFDDLYAPLIDSIKQE